MTATWLTTTTHFHRSFNFDYNLYIQSNYKLWSNILGLVTHAATMQFEVPHMPVRSAWLKHRKLYTTPNVCVCVCECVCCCCCCFLSRFALFARLISLGHKLNLGDKKHRVNSDYKPSRSFALISFSFAKMRHIQTYTYSLSDASHRATLGIICVNKGNNNI